MKPQKLSNYPWPNRRTICQYLSFIHEKANCIAIFWTGGPHSLGSCHFRGVRATCLPHKSGGNLPIRDNADNAFSGKLFIDTHPRTCGILENTLGSSNCGE